jgi:predicted RNA-binding Zn-ribbon protein involved in translation (DUF1610 family)
MSGHKPWPPGGLDECARCGKKYRARIETDFKCPKCGYQSVETRLLAMIFKKRKKP